MIFIITLNLIFSIIIIKEYSKRIKEPVITYTESEVKKIITLVINNSVNNYLINKDNNIMTLKKNNNNEIELINIDTIKTNKYIKDITKIIETNLKTISQNGTNDLDIDLDAVSDFNYEYIHNNSVLEVTSGSFTKSFLLANLGPYIPIKMNITDEVICNVKTKVKDYGINNALVEIDLETKVNAMINTPFISSSIEVKKINPIYMNIIQGKIPENYLGNKFIKNSKLT